MSKQSWLVALALALGGVLLTEAPIEGAVLDASWTAPTTNTDGTPLTDLASYLVYYGTADSPCPASSFLQVASSTSSPDPDQTVSARLTGLITGTRYYVSVSAVDTTGNQSACSATANAVARDNSAGDISPSAMPQPATPSSAPLSSASLSATPASTSPGKSITATWSGIAAPTPTDWVGLYAEGTAGGAYLAWIYLSCSQTPGPADASGSCVIQIPRIARPGRYELRLYADNMFIRLATSSPFKVRHRHRQF